MGNSFPLIETRPVLVLIASIALLSCAQVASEEVSPSWQTLASDAYWVEGTQRVQRFVSADGAEYRLGVLGTNYDEFWLETTLRPSHWTYRPELHDGVWTTSTPVKSAGQPAAGDEQRLTSLGRTFRFNPPDMRRNRWNLAEGDFANYDGVTYLKLSAIERPPNTALLSMFAGAGRGAGRVSGDQHSGAGFSLWPGESVERHVDIPAGHVLRFATALEPALNQPDGAKRGVVYRIRLDGKIVFEYTQSETQAVSSNWHEVPLPPHGARGVQLRFEVSGALAYSSFIAPVISPADVGDFAVRPWTGSRPDIVLFLADTFRADNLEAYGDKLGLTPYLNEIARGSRLFKRAWSVGTYTLPAHASMFSGVYPHQAGILGIRRALPDELVTIAETLSAAGYRTGAITDSAIVSNKYGLSQGFEWFHENHDSVTATAERVRTFLDADDGRPVFLFVQSYRTHIPYEVSDHVRDERGGELGIADERFWDLENERMRIANSGKPRDSVVAARTAATSGLRGLYRGAAIDLDHGFHTIHQRLEERGLLDEGYLIFTSDHGEALAEHGTFYHTGTPFEEQSRIPLLIVGPDVAPASVDHAASLVDLAPTIADMARAPVNPVWRGRSLLTLDVDRPAFVFECKRGEGATVAVIEGNHKIISLEDPESIARGEIKAAFDLDTDPRESHNLLFKNEAPWSAEMIERLGPTVANLLVPIVGPESAQLSQDALRQLRALGYLNN